MKPGLVLCLSGLLLGLLTGCQMFSRDPTVSSDFVVAEYNSIPPEAGQCGAPPAMPPLDNSALAVIAWLHFNDQLTTLTPMQQWRLLLNYTVHEPGADLAAALVTSHPTAPDALRLLSQGTFKRRLPGLPMAVRPVFTQVMAYNDAVLLNHDSMRQLERARHLYEKRVERLEQALAEKDRQIEALTDIESRLNEGGTGGTDTPGGGNAGPPPESGEE